MPDALSKTVPIWCAVINRAVPKTTLNINVDADAWNTKLYTPPGVVSAQEHDQIEQKLDEWADISLSTSFHVLPKLQYLIRTIWITPSTTIFPKFPDSDAEQRFYPIICISASKQVLEIEQGLTPAQFWKHKQTSSAQTVTNYQPSFKLSHPSQIHSPHALIQILTRHFVPYPFNTFTVALNMHRS
ncbi:initiator tRNA phosphoribosyl transferase-domain-containing protein [Suillus tomentosus]|nr:initiator tRNA phosphoribosyl transferase-domain-containing protein [Suillus tomentosus]